MSARYSVQAEARPEVMRVLQTKDETKAFYNKISKVYDLLADQSEAPVRHAGLEKLNAHPGERALEIGFGTGHCLIALAQAVGPTGKVYGIDLSEEMLKVAQGRLEKEGLDERAKLTCGDATELPYSSETMDAIFTSFTLELFDTPEIPRVLAECRRALRPGGRIVVVGMSKEGEDRSSRQVYEGALRPLPNYHRCRPIFMRRAVEVAGFRVEGVDKG